MNFTSSPFERMMKEVPHPGWDNDDPCKGCRYYKECKAVSGFKGGSFQNHISLYCLQEIPPFYYNIFMVNIPYSQ